MSGGGNSDPVLQLQDLTILGSDDARRRACARPLVEAVSLSIGSGETLGLVGESGSGKTLTGRAALGLCPVGLVSKAARIVVDGCEGGPSEHDFARRIAGRLATRVPQAALSALNPLLQIGTQLTEAWVALGLGGLESGRSEALGLLGRLGVADAAAKLSCYPHELSGGERQRVLIAMALICRPKLLVADEPTTALDAATQRKALRLLHDWQVEHATAILLITHDLAVVAHAARRIAVMYAGQIIELGPTTDVLERPAHPYTRALMACTPSIRDDVGLPGHQGRPLLPTPIPGSYQPRSVDDVGCAFAARCSEVTERCRAGRVALRELAAGRAVRCLRA